MAHHNPPKDHRLAVFGLRVARQGRRNRETLRRLIITILSLAVLAVAIFGFLRFLRSMTVDEATILIGVVGLLLAGLGAAFAYPRRIPPPSVTILPGDSFGLRVGYGGADFPSQPDFTKRYLDLALRRLRPQEDDAADVLRDASRAFLPVKCLAVGRRGKAEDARDFVRRAFEELNARTVLLVGDYGMGKSFVAERLFVEQAQSCLLDAEGRTRLPILLKLSKVASTDRHSILKHLADHLYQQGFLPDDQPGAESAVETLLQDGRALCILDGFDEIPAVSFAMWGASGYEAVEAKFVMLADALSMGDNQVMITSRVGVLPGVLQPSFGKDLRGLELGRLQTWEPDRDWPDYVTMCHGNGIDVPRGLQQMVASRPELSELTATPLYCQMLVASGPELATTPNLNVGRLYHLYIRQYFLRIQARGPLQTRLTGDEQVKYKNDCLVETARMMLEKTSTRLTADQIAEALGPLAVRTDGELQKAFTQHETLTYSLLVMDAKDCYAFSHRSFYEFYLAEKVYRQLMTSTGMSGIVRDHLLSREVVRFLADLTGPSVAFLTRVHAALANPADASSHAEMRLRRNLALLVLERNGLLKDVNLRGLNFRGYDFSRVRQPRLLRNVTLDQADLDGANLSGVQLPGSSLRAASMNDAVLDGADLRGVDWEAATINGISCEGTRFNGMRLGNGLRGDKLARVTVVKGILAEAKAHRKEVDADWRSRAVEALESGDLV